MTNLEFYQDWLLKEGNTSSLDFIFSLDFKEKFGLYVNNISDLVKWGNEQHKYELTKCEHDMLETNDMSHNRKLSSFATYNNMRRKGWFRGVDFDKTINEVLKDCVIVDDFYAK